MQLEYHEDDPGLLIIKSTGGLDESLAMKLVRDLYALIDKGLTKTVVDCSQMDYISSLDLGVLARVRSRIAMKGGDLKLCGVKGMVQEVLKITRMDRVFDIHPDLESARRAFETQ